MESLDLNLLMALHALLEERNVTPAGQRVGLSQPAMSSNLARLRRHYGDDLLIRVGNAYELTPLASTLVDPAHRWLRETLTTVGHKIEQASDDTPR